MNSGAIFINRKAIYLHSYSTAKAGYSIASEPFIRLDIGVDYLQLVKAIREVLSNSNIEVPNPNFSELDKKVSTALGIKSVNELERSNFKHCSIKLKENILIFTPTKHADYPDKGYVHSSNSPVTVNYQADDKEVYEALQLAISRCD